MKKLIIYVSTPTNGFQWVKKWFPFFAAFGWCMRVITHSPFLYKYKWSLLVIPFFFFFSCIYNMNGIYSTGHWLFDGLELINKYMMDFTLHETENYLNGQNLYFPSFDLPPTSFYPFIILIFILSWLYALPFVMHESMRTTPK